ncbi:S-layer homology domain-containing protein [Solibacillus sp. FSL R7-0668]|uniref:S-layer homology domain-containing protein n=1 Tax=Solibacillus sp. FSL R7-0668 TaxID=2921688 RepID=UPI0030F8F677
MNQSKKILAALVAVPASVVVADGAMAAEETVSFAKSLDGLLIALEDKENEEADAKDKAAAEEVTRLIAELSNESTAVEIIAARTAYDALSEAAKKYISKSTLEALVYYETRIEELTEIAKKEAAVVQDRIDRITSSYTEAQVKNIRIAYNALSQLAKEYVTNLQKLIDAENKIIYDNTVVKQAKLDANAFDVYMNDITRNSTQAEIAKARAYYNNLSTEAKKHVTTYEKLVRLETMWKDPKYIDLVYTYYPDYIHDIKPGGIVIEKPKYDSIYIPDDSETDSSSSSYTPSTDWTTYETMKYQNGRYTASITTTQAQSIKDRSKILKADDIEIVIPSADLYAATATVGVTVNVTNNQLNIQFKQGKQAKTFSEYVEIHVPFNVLNGNASQIIERVAESSSSASFKIEGSSFIIRTKTSGTFKATAAPAYSDLPNNAQGTAMRELAKRGILFEAKPRLSQSYKQVTKFEAASMMATALGLSSASKSSYQDVKNERDLQQVQGLLEAGIMSGFTSSYFNGEGAVTKQEAAIMIANMYRYLNRDVSRAYSGFPSSFKDITYLSLEARQSIAILELFGVVNAADSFGPTKELTRGEFAELFYNALKAIDYL